MFRDAFCPYCDASLTRSAKLVLRLEKNTAWLHRVLAHQEGNWRKCEEEPCMSTNKVLNDVEAPTQ